MDVPAEAVSALEPAFARSEVHQAESWVERCRQDLAQLWRAGELWAVSEVLDTKNGRALHIVAMAGRWQEGLLAQIEAWGRSVGCSTSFFTGRRGWARRVPQYRIRTVTLEKEI